MTENNSPFLSSESTVTDPLAVQLPEEVTLKDDFGAGSQHKSTARFARYKKIPLKVVLGILAVFTLVSGASAAFYLTGKSSELRQQASGGYLECSQGVKDGQKACSGFREYVTCHNGAFGAASRCGDNQVCQGGNCVGEAAKNCADGTAPGRTSCDTGTSYVTCGSNGLFGSSTSCGSNKICREGGCKNMDGSAIVVPTTPAAVKDADQIVSCFTGSDCKEGPKVAKSACDKDNGYTSKSACTAAVSASKPAEEQKACFALPSCESIGTAAVSKCTGDGKFLDQNACKNTNTYDAYFEANEITYVVPGCQGQRGVPANIESYGNKDECIAAAKHTVTCFTSNATKTDCVSVPNIVGTACPRDLWSTYPACHSRLPAPQSQQPADNYQLASNGLSCVTCTGSSCIRKAYCDQLAATNIANAAATTIGQTAAATLPQSGVLPDTPAQPVQRACWTRGTCAYSPTTDPTCGENFNNFNLCTSVRDATTQAQGNGSLSNANGYSIPF